MWASHYGHKEAIEALLSANADINKKSKVCMISCCWLVFYVFKLCDLFFFFFIFFPLSSFIFYWNRKGEQPLFGLLLMVVKRPLTSCCQPMQMLTTKTRFFFSYIFFVICFIHCSCYLNRAE